MDSLQTFASICSDPNVFITNAWRTPMEEFDLPIYSGNLTTSPDDVYSGNGTTSYLTFDLSSDKEMLSMTLEWLFMLCHQLQIFQHLCLVMGILGLLLNILTIVVIANGTNVGRKIKVQLINLTMAHLLGAVGLLIFTFSIQTFNMFLMVIGNGIIMATMQASVLCNMAISLERFVIISFPLRARRYRRVHKCVIAGLIWPLAILGASGPVLAPFTGTFTLETVLVLLLLDIVIYIAIPSLIIATINIGLCIKLKCHKSLGERISTRQPNNCYRKVIKYYVLSLLISVVSQSRFYNIVKM